MTVSMRVISAGDGYKYLMKSVAAGDGNRALSTPLTRYYTETGCPPGVWYGSGMTALNSPITEGDQVSEQQLALVMGKGCHPTSGIPLGRPYSTYPSVEQRVAARIEQLDTTMDNVHREQSIGQITEEEQAKSVRKAVAGFDFTFSVPKSVSVLWACADAATQTRIVEAHHQAMKDVIDYIEANIAATRTGHGGIIQADVSGIIAAGFDHWDSRSGDPQLHTHLVVANKAKTVSDGVWRTLDSRALHAAIVTASALYNGLLADRLSAQIGVEWESRDRGDDRNPAWEITGISDTLIKHFSSRAGDIDTVTDGLIADYRSQHGRLPSARTIMKLRQQATLDTRPPKVMRSLADLTSRWRHATRALIGKNPTNWAVGLTGHQDRIRFVRAADITSERINQIAADVLEAVTERRSTWRRNNLAAEANRHTMGIRFATTADRQQVIDRIVTIAIDQSICLTPEPLAVPASFRRANGTSRLRPANSTRYTSRQLWNAEARLLKAADNLSAPAISPADAESGSHDMSQVSGVQLGTDQQTAINNIVTSGRMADVLVGPAGTGKTTTLAALRAVWEGRFEAGSVVGLAPSATAAAILAQDLGIGTENTARWLTLHTYGKADFAKNQLVLVDEASLAGTLTLDRLTTLASKAGAKIVLVGDTSQLQAIEAGGAFNLLVTTRDDPPTLSQVHRFTHPWERQASLSLRKGDTSVLDTYQQHGRISGGTLDEMTAAAYQAWRADCQDGLDAILITDSTGTVTVLNRQARHDLVIAGVVKPGREVMLAAGTRASEGDMIITRLNKRSLVAGYTGPVRNGDRWTVVTVHRDGSITARRVSYRRGATVTLPSDYVASHVDLGYAVTAHRAQGVTVDTAHVVVTAATSRADLYVAMTRGKLSNRVWVATDQPDPDHTWPADQDITAKDVLVRILSKPAEDASAHQTAQAETEQWASTAQLRAEITELITASQQARWRHLITSHSEIEPHTARQITGSDLWQTICGSFEQADRNGPLAPETLLSRMVAARPLNPADPATDLAGRLTAFNNQPRPAHRMPAKTRPPVLGIIRLPATITDTGTTQAINLRIQAIHDRATTYLDKALTDRQPWLSRLGLVPAGPGAAARWREVALAVAAYRDAWNITADTPLGKPATRGQQADAHQVNRLINTIKQPSPENLRSAQRSRPTPQL